MSQKKLCESRESGAHDYRHAMCRRHVVVIWLGTGGGPCLVVCGRRNLKPSHHFPPCARHTQQCSIVERGAESPSAPGLADVSPRHSPRPCPARPAPTRTPVPVTRYRVAGIVSATGPIISFSYSCKLTPHGRVYRVSRVFPVCVPAPPSVCLPVMSRACTPRSDKCSPSRRTRSSLRC